ncbi:Restriction of telomere capping protein 4 [Hanseniaspora osmophila]|uniref:Restriction of telomere capping protein 4 n=1 Tax=Hanseniaspora osmophila TaxID=56408 RepID=A0A1E5RGS2_9ASCO|nr:Restriction of telomere capping protein 4 [Hanseniaspora osmophila]
MGRSAADTSFDRDTPSKQNGQRKLYTKNVLTTLSDSGLSAMKTPISSLRSKLRNNLAAQTTPKKRKLSKHESKKRHDASALSSCSDDNNYDGDDEKKDGNFEDNDTQGIESASSSDIENDLELAKTSLVKRHKYQNEPEFKRYSIRNSTKRIDYKETSSENSSTSGSEGFEQDDAGEDHENKNDSNDIDIDIDIGSSTRRNNSFTFYGMEDMPVWDAKYTDLEHYKKDMDDDLVNAAQIDPDSLKKDYVKLNTYDDKMMLLNKKLEVRTKYTTKYPTLPVPPYFLELKDQIEPYLKEIPDLLKAKTTTFYYATAKEMHMNSSRPAVTDGDIKAKLMSEPEKLSAGAYGLKRQFQVGEWIIDRYQKEIMERYGNPVIKWWGYEDFARYILSCDVLTRLLKDQMRLRSLKKAFEVMNDTVEYGNFVSDDDPFHPWELDIELEKIKESNLDEKYQSTFYRK